MDIGAWVERMMLTKVLPPGSGFFGGVAGVLTRDEMVWLKRVLFSVPFVLESCTTFCGSFDFDFTIYVYVFLIFLYVVIGVSGEWNKDNEIVL